MSAFDARSATEVNIPQWSPFWVSEDVSKLTIVRLNASHSPTRQNETLEGCRNRRARQIDRAWAEVNAKCPPCCRNKLEGFRNGRARQIERARAEVNAKRIRHKLSAQIPTKKGSKIEVKMTGRNARAHEVQNNNLHDQAKPD